jgi:hypothetical protein
MFRKPTKTYRDRLRDVFYQIRVHPWYERIMLLPFPVRLIAAIFLFFCGIIGLVTPIPAGWLMILASGVLIFGIRVIQRHSVRLFFMLRLHRVHEWIVYHTKRK